MSTSCSWMRAGLLVGKTPSAMHQLAVDIAFETDDRWIAEIYDQTEAGRPLMARCVFTRSARQGR